MGILKHVKQIRDKKTANLMSCQSLMPVLILRYEIKLDNEFPTQKPSPKIDDG